MTKHNFFSQLKYYFFTHKKKSPEGFSFIETIVAMTILSIAFAINLQFLLMLKVQNLEQKITTGAVSLSKEILEGIRYDFRETFDTIPKFRTKTINKLGSTIFQLTDNEKKDFGGYKYKVVVTICSNEYPAINNNNVISNCGSNAASNIRSIIIQVTHPKIIKYTYDKNTGQSTSTTSEQVYYTAQAAFTRLK
ncbi:hypothetical protein GM3708_1001 [Geminocystis sp. NIES-3708]|uniref:type IV pilus modification PilV family protein n=1 Tax=Geminocystis sp. NIES-3708 TaxID=1615909 RepID=UPI0005FC3B92|nr:type II secretion system protein [Geminocystis sp. NIES-3708]BAQ60595.1 hypothetical protein GM3708_1001 [Geminocystis sp. NIES-3708]